MGHHILTEFETVNIRNNLPGNGFLLLPEGGDYYFYCG